MHKTSITHISNEHNDWLRSLSFYKQELNILKERLTEIAGKNTDHSLGPIIEHYQNQFEIQLSNISLLYHSINKNVHDIASEVKQNIASFIDNRLVEQHYKLKEMYNSEEKTIGELRHTFNRFAAEWM
jgi:hypothetical protein